MTFSPSLGFIDPDKIVILISTSISSVIKLDTWSSSYVEERGGGLT